MIGNYVQYIKKLKEKKIIINKFGFSNYIMIWNEKKLKELFQNKKKL